MGLYIYVTDMEGNDLPVWLSYEDVTMTISGTPAPNSTDITILVTADDR